MPIVPKPRAGAQVHTRGSFTQPCVAIALGKGTFRRRSLSWQDRTSATRAGLRPHARVRHNVARSTTRGANHRQVPPPKVRAQELLLGCCAPIGRPNVCLMRPASGSDPEGGLRRVGCRAPDRGVRVLAPADNVAGLRDTSDMRTRTQSHAPAAVATSTGDLPPLPARSTIAPARTMI